MNKSHVICGILILFSFVACNPFEDKKGKEQDDVSQDSLTTETAAAIYQFNKDSIAEHQLFMIDVFRVFDDEKKPQDIINNSWLDLHTKDNKYYLDSLDYSIEMAGEDACSGYPLQEVKSNRNSLLFMNIPSLHKGEVETIFSMSKVMCPNESYSFQFNNNGYELKATGEISLQQNYVDDFGKQVQYCESTDYSLAIYMNGKLQNRILDNETFDQTTVSLVFVGDLDKDGYADFIISAPRHYEEQRYLLILSSDNKIYEAYNSFDC
ncbi:integrin alpha [Sphingobacterium hungaricum]|uniref:Repeat domain-containing protein n=1 Tax=Sphingobacterium hungaricum TaxID=2082723 RepID=A0A928V333_9SPHI|nr:integrin alpha [Sphingobacterium hungaricum]MBE8715219.1 hypothetical protein [Sphingobacterium hungaricum]